MLIIISGRYGTSCKYLHKHLIPRTHASTRVWVYGREGEAAWLVSVLRARINRCCCICDFVLVFNPAGRNHRKWYIYNPAFCVSQPEWTTHQRADFALFVHQSNNAERSQVNLEAHCWASLVLFAVIALVEDHSVFLEHYPGPTVVHGVLDKNLLRTLNCMLLGVWLLQKKVWLWSRVVRVAPLPTPKIIES